MKLTPSLNARVSGDWAALFPSFGVYRPRHLLRRIGPILQGIALERDGSNECYLPTLHVHSLLRSCPFVTLTLAQVLLTARTRAPESIPARAHEARFRDAAARLRLQSELPLDGPLSFSALERVYLSYLARPGPHYDAEVREELALLYAWAGRPQEASALVRDGAEAIAVWPYGLPSHIGGADRWRAKLLEKLTVAEKLGDVAEANVVALGAGQLPSATLEV